MWRYAVPSFIWTAVVTVLCLLPGKDLPEVNIVNFDKFSHLFVFGLLCWLYLRWHKAVLGKSFKGGLAVTMAIMLYGGLMEVLQGAFYIDRSADLLDAAANCTGCLIAFAIHLRK
jgi:VanZ family protein